MAARHRPRRIASAVAAMVLVANLLGCAASVAPATVNRAQFDQLYGDSQTFTDVWYTGSDAQYHHFCMEHWTLKPDGSDGTRDSQKFFQLPVAEMHVRKPIPVSDDPEKWQLLRPTKTSEVQGG